MQPFGCQHAADRTQQTVPEQAQFCHRTTADRPRIGSVLSQNQDRLSHKHGSVSHRTHYSPARRTDHRGELLWLLLRLKHENLNDTPTLRNPLPPGGDSQGLSHPVILLHNLLRVQELPADRVTPGHTVTFHLEMVVFAYQEDYDSITYLITTLKTPDQ